MDRQAKEEIRIFREFAKIFPYTIVLSSIRKEEPPKPDIYCELEDGTPIAFELVECIDDSLARLSSDTPKLLNLLRKEVEVLPKEKKEEFYGKLGNTIINVSFVERASIRMKKWKISTIIDYLLTLEDHAEGPYPMRDHQALRNVVRLINITRGPFSRPDFISFPVNWIAEPAKKRIEEKFNKRYDIKSKTELFAYYKLQPAIPESHWLSEVQDFVQNNIDGSSFQRVWIYSFYGNQIIYVYPPL